MNNVKNLLFLNFKSNSTKIKIKIVNKIIYVKNVFYFIVNSNKFFFSFFKMIYINREIRETRKNDVFSRDHFVCILDLFCVFLENKKNSSNFFLIDLIDNERFEINETYRSYIQKTQYINANRAQFHHAIQNFKNSKFIFTRNIIINSQKNYV